jgi:hypothetical protein
MVRLMIEATSTIGVFGEEVPFGLGSGYSALLPCM